MSSTHEATLLATSCNLVIYACHVLNYLVTVTFFALRLRLLVWQSVMIKEVVMFQSCDPK